MKKILSILLVLACLLALSACGGDSPAASAAQERADAAPETAAPADSGTVITLTGGGAEIAGGGARVQGGTVTISAVGTYTLSGKLDEGQIIVNTGDDAMDVTLVLDGASISNSAGPAIQILQAKNLRLQLRGENRLQSGVRTDMASFDGTASGAALFSEDDLDIEGEGSLEVLGYLNNGITCKDDLDINSGAITVTAANNGIRGSESVEIKGGTVTVSCGNDGVKASSAKKEGKGGLFGRLGAYLGDVRGEMHRVVWPSKPELKNYSVAVIAMLIVCGIAVWLVDTGFVALLVGFTGLRG